MAYTITKWNLSRHCERIWSVHNIWSTQCRVASSLKNTFRTCLPCGSNSGWLPLDNLYTKQGDCGQKETLTIDKERVINTPNQLLYVARHGLRCQVFDTVLWQDLYERSLELAPDFQTRQWVELLHIYKRIKIRHRGLLDIVTREVMYQLERLSLEDLSKLALSMAWNEYCHNEMFDRIADVITTRLSREKIQEIPQGSIDPSTNKVSTKVGGNLEARNNDNLVVDDTNQPAKNIALSKITSYTHLLGAYAKCEFEHRELFEAVAVDLMDQLESKEMLIPQGFLVKLLASYAKFGYRHAPLFDALSKEMVTAKIPTGHLAKVQQMMKALQYENALMNSVFAYRLGNVTQC
ncbi:hypothetical protein BaOVIS_008240 [Babesia ovis]|uniref:Uncharacterized protein n=1 Tax=Babesia ovis TaxID=5869 RepID=A0A9W5T9M4_BABOV|nr:hypothetical protein BaOVIS_008240 [Babesia ovis]